MAVPVSGEVTGDGAAHLVGPAMVRLVAAIPRVQELLGQPVVVGGLAVMSRLGRAHRVTRDLDALRRRHEGDGSGLEVLRAAEADDVDTVGGLIATARGLVRVDVLDAGHADLDREFTDPTDRLEAEAHQWALETATRVTVTATEHDPRGARGETGRMGDTVQAVALVARPGPLVAMKLKASMDRTTVKEATDLLDVVHLVTDPLTAGSVLTEFETAGPQLIEDVAVHATWKFDDGLPRTRRIIRELGRHDVDEELIDAAAAFLHGALRSFP